MPMPYNLTSFVGFTTSLRDKKKLKMRILHLILLFRRRFLGWLVRSIESYRICFRETTIFFPWSSVLEICCVQLTE